LLCLLFVTCFRHTCYSLCVFFIACYFHCSLLSLFSPHLLFIDCCSFSFAIVIFYSLPFVVPRCLLLFIAYCYLLHVVVHGMVLFVVLYYLSVIIVACLHHLLLHCWSILRYQLPTPLCWYCLSLTFITYYYLLFILVLELKLVLPFSLYWLCSLGNVEYSIAKLHSRFAKFFFFI